MQTAIPTAESKMKIPTVASKHKRFGTRSRASRLAMDSRDSTNTLAQCRASGDLSRTVESMLVARDGGVPVEVGVEVADGGCEVKRKFACGEG